MQTPTQKALIEKELFDLFRTGQGKHVLFDTETTGLPDDPGFQVVEIAGLDLITGATLFDTLVRPTCSIPPGATAAHGIEDEDVATSPTFAKIWPDIRPHFEGATLWTYNSDFDSDALQASASLHGFTLPIYPYRCAMRLYAKYYGERRYGGGGYKFQSLDIACSRLGIKRCLTHRALADAQDARAVLLALAQEEERRQ